jgi:cytochrome P450
LLKNKINDYHPLLEKRRTILLGQLYDLTKTSTNTIEGSSLNKFIEHYSMTNILSILYGSMFSFAPGDSQLHSVFELTDKLAQSLGPADQLRVFFPILQTIWPVKREKYLKLREEFLEFHSTLLNQFKEKYNKDPESVDDCFVKEVTESGELTELQIMYFVGVFVGAGSDTTATAIDWLIGLMANHPEIQEKAYEEIKQAIGLDRLPNVDDGMMHLTNILKD